MEVFFYMVCPPARCMWVPDCIGFIYDHIQANEYMESTQLYGRAHRALVHDLYANRGTVCPEPRSRRALPLSRGRRVALYGAGVAELGPRGKFRCIFTAEFTAYCS